MNQATAEQQAQEELGRFIKVAFELSEQDRGSAFMPAGLVDEVWHRLVTSGEDTCFMREVVGTTVIHNSQTKGQGKLDWVPLYEAQYGSLTPVWFTDKDGKVDRPAYSRYLQNGTLVASWDCSPYFPEQDKNRGLKKRKGLNAV